MRNKDEVTAIVVSVVTAVYGIRVIECQLEREEMLTIEQIWWIVFSKTSKRRGILLLTPYKSISLHVSGNYVRLRLRGPPRKTHKHRHLESECVICGFQKS